MTTTTTTPTTGSSGSSGSATASASASASATGQPGATEREVTFEHLVSGRLALQVLRNQLDTTIAGLRAQLVVAEAQKTQAEDMLRRTDEKIARQYPDSYAVLHDAPAGGATEAAERRPARAPERTSERTSAPRRTRR